MTLDRLPLHELYWNRQTKWSPFCWVICVGNVYKPWDMGMKIVAGAAFECWTWALMNWSGGGEGMSCTEVCQKPKVGNIIWSIIQRHWPCLCGHWIVVAPNLRNPPDLERGGHPLPLNMCWIGTAGPLWKDTSPLPSFQASGDLSHSTPFFSPTQVRLTLAYKHLPFTRCTFPLTGAISSPHSSPRALSSQGIIWLDMGEYWNHDNQLTVQDCLSAYFAINKCKGIQRYHLRSSFGEPLILGSSDYLQKVSRP